MLPCWSQGCSAAASEVSGRSFMQIQEGAFCRAPMSPCWWTGLPLGWSFRLWVCAGSGSQTVSLARLQWVGWVSFDCGESVPVSRLLDGKAWGLIYLLVTCTSGLKVPFRKSILKVEWCQLSDMAPLSLLFWLGQQTRVVATQNQKIWDLIALNQNN